MKRLIYVFALTFFLFSCNDEDKDPNMLTNEESLVNAVENSTWRISLFIEEGENETSDYSGITLNFLPEGKIEAFSGGQLLEVGTWRTLRDDGEVEFWITFTQNELLQEISEDWYLIAVSPTEIQLEEGDNDEEDFLTLSKI